MDSLKELRLYRNHTRKSLGNELGVGKTTVWYWETGERIPNLVHYAKLCKVLKISHANMLKILIKE